MNLIPSHASHDTHAYYCTWSAQNAFWPFSARKVKDSDFLGDQGAEHARDYMTEENIFGHNGLIHQFPEVRSQMLFMLDDGWDVPFGVHPTTQCWRFGSLIPDSDRFPSCRGEPAERLAALVRMVRSHGWKGLGIWVASQAVGEDPARGNQSDTEMESYWTERLRWSAQADVSYWKVDWGHRCDDISWRHRLCELRDIYAPDLIIEHCLCMRPLNNVVYEGDFQIGSGSFADWDDIPHKCAEIGRYSDVFRTYDVLHPFAEVSTLDRIAYLLPALNGTQCILNCEDAPYVGAVLGCAIGVMRFKPPMLTNAVPLTEVTRAIHWQKLAPPFPSNGESYSSEGRVTDSAFYHSGDTWFAPVLNHTAVQSCPEVISRGIMPTFITYEEDLHPILLFSANPACSVSVASVPRNIVGSKVQFPLASAEIPVGNAAVPVGIFGRWKSVTLSYEVDINDYTVWAQDLASNSAVDITSRVILSGRSITVPGDCITEIGTMANGEGDISEPGLVIRLSK